MTQPMDDRVLMPIRCSSQFREDVKAFAEASGISANEFACRALHMAMDRRSGMSENANVPNHETLEQVQERDQAALQSSISDPVDDDPGTVRLETVPNFKLYDTQFQMNPYQWPKGMSLRLLENPAPIMFFQSPGGRGPAFTNMLTSGMLCWPKRMEVRCMTLQLDRELDPKVLRELSLQFRIGEKIQAVVPVSMMVRDGLQWAHSLGSPGFIPSVKHFSVSLDTDGNYLGETEIRVSLIGDLYREIV